MTRPPTGGAKQQDHDMLDGLLDLLREHYQEMSVPPVVVKPLADVPFIPLPDGSELVWDPFTTTCDLWRRGELVQGDLTSEQVRVFLTGGKSA